MIAPNFSMQLNCSQCSWKKTVRQNSDALDVSLIPEQCPQCGGELLCKPHENMPSKTISIINHIMRR